MVYGLHSAHFECSFRIDIRVTKMNEESALVIAYCDPTNHAIHVFHIYFPLYSTSFTLPI